MSFQNKYIKYKNKYLDLKNSVQTGGMQPMPMQTRQLGRVDNTMRTDTNADGSQVVRVVQHNPVPSDKFVSQPRETCIHCRNINGTTCNFCRTNTLFSRTESNFTVNIADDYGKTVEIEVIDNKLDNKIIGSSNERHGNVDNIVAYLIYDKDANESSPYKYHFLSWPVKCRDKYLSNKDCESILDRYISDNSGKIKQLVIKTIKSSPYKSR
jgi:hypothetical protein